MAELAEVRYLEREARKAPEAVAVVLEDGTVQPLGARRMEVTEGLEFAQGSVSGSGWILWFQRRSFGVR
ncbi:MAG: hypothetical protein ACRDHO_14430 [Actinomycetota bacterium]